jgi:hypothetical protein
MGFPGDAGPNPGDYIRSMGGADPSADDLETERESYEPSWYRILKLGATRVDAAEQPVEARGSGVADATPAR